MSIPSGMLIEKYRRKKTDGGCFHSGILRIPPAGPGSQLSYGVASLFLIGSGMAMLQVVINPLLRMSGGEEHYAFNSVLAQLIFGLRLF